jgi:hypothetical protein
MSSRGGPLALILLLGAVTLLAGSDGPMPPKGGDKKPAPEPEPPPTKKIDALRLPAEAVLVIYEHAVEALRQVPDAVVLSAKKYQELLDENARLREQLAPKKPLSPSRCVLRGKVEGNVALLTAQFDFVTEKPDTLVALACGQGLATAAALDGRTPLFKPDGADPATDGFVVQVDKPGEHQLTLDLVVRLNGRGAGQGIELSLPRAAVTTLELELPPGVKDVRVGGKPWAETLVTLAGNRLSGGLGSADKLDLGWKGARATPGTPLLAAEGRVVVRLDARGLDAAAELTLHAEAGQVAVWRLLVPRGAEVRLAPEDEDRLAKPIETADQPAGSLRTLHLREAGSDPLKVVVTVHSAAPKPGDRLGVGPFAVPGAARLAGTILVSNALADLHLDYLPRAGVERRPLTDDERRADPALVAAFRYGGVILPDAPARPEPLLEMTAEPVHGQIKARVSHLLSLRPTAGGGPLAWHSTTTIVATPRWADVEQFKVQLPPGWEPTEDLGPLSVDGQRVVTLKLPRAPGDPPLRPVTLTLEGRYTDKPKGTGTATLALPRPLGTDDQGGEVAVQVGRDLELAQPAALAGLEAGKQGPHEQSWRGRPLPEALTVSWKSYVPDIRVQSLADVDLTPRGGDVWRHELRFQLPQPPPAQLALRVPGGVTGLDVVEGGTLPPREPLRDASGNPLRVVSLGKGTGGEHRLVLRYGFAAVKPADAGGAFTVPLVAPDAVTRSEARVRLWCEPGVLPVLLDGTPWAERRIEEIAERKTLPVLVAAAPRADAPLSLRWDEPRSAYAVLVERALVRVRLDEAGTQRYAVRYRLSQLAAGNLDVELPDFVGTIELRVTLDRRPVTPEILDDAGQPSTSGRVARLRLSPELVRPSAILEISYQLLPGRGWPAADRLTTLLQAPRLSGDPGGAPTRWEVVAPASWVVLGPESGPGVERGWARRSWLWAPRLSRTAGGDDALAPEESESDESPAVVCWRSGAEPLTLTHAPQQAWMLACSLGLLVVGLALVGRGQAARGLTWLVILLGLAVAAGAVLRPAVLTAVLYGCEPGAAVLAAVLLMQWLLHERYRRQVVFLPSFSRPRSGSSLNRGSSTPRQPPGEPSTVDVPRPAGSSAK